MGVEKVAPLAREYKFIAKKSLRGGWYYGSARVRIVFKSAALRGAAPRRAGAHTLLQPMPMPMLTAATGPPHYATGCTSANYSNNNSPYQTSEKVPMYIVNTQIGTGN